LENRSPRPGEPPRYARSADKDVTYADIAVIPNIDRSRTIVIFNAIDMLGAEAAGEFAMNGSLSVAVGGKPSAEIMIRVRSIGGTASKSEIVAIRELLP